MIIMLTLALSSISLTACSSMSGNVVPEKGPTMEQVYDSMEPTEPPKPMSYKLKTQSIVPLTVSDNTFQKLPNPELKMYVYPHLAGNDEVPIPGYYTAFNAYTQDHYALANETIRE
jgi:conjugative transfer region lipoprotein (TIGR03751 family)